MVPHAPDTATTHRPRQRIRALIARVVGLSSTVALVLSVCGLAAAFGVSTAAPAQAATTDGTLRVQVIRDVTGSGVWDPVLDPGLAGVTVTVTDATGHSVTLTTDASGLAVLSQNFTLVGGKYRVEVINPKPGLFYPAIAATSGTPSATNLSTDVEFVDVSAGKTATVTTGFWNPNDYCQSNARLVNACQPTGVAGASVLTGASPVPGPSAPTARTLWTAPYNAMGYMNGVQDLATNADTGTVYGIDYRKQDKRIFSAAYAKRGSNYGPGGPGGIYVTTAAGVTSLFTTVPNAGTTQHHFANTAAERQDEDFRQVVGKESLGDLVISEDGTQLYVVNLFDRSVYVYDATQATASAPLKVIPIPDPGCASNSDWRPSGLGVQDGQVYVGGVCSAESTGSRADLRAVVYQMSAATLTIGSVVLNQSLDFNRPAPGWPENSTEPCYSPTPSGVPWYPWKDTTNCNVAAPWQSAPTPMLSDIDVETNGDLVLAFRDRTQDQLGWGLWQSENSGGVAQNALTPGGSQTGYVPGGSINKACPNASGMFVLDTNGACGVAAGGEFYTGQQQTAYSGQGAFAGMALDKVEHGVAVNVVDPQNNLWQTGYTRMDRFGQANPLTEIGDEGRGNTIESVAGSNLWGKSGGLADMAVLCDLAPIQIGNRVWYDTNGNGVQDAGEAPVPGATVRLYDANGNLVATTTTNANGEYYFDSIHNGLQPNTNYTVRIDNPANFAPGAPLDSTKWQLTQAQAGTGSQAPLLDSNGTVVGGFPQASVTTGSAGQNNHSVDFGFSPIPAVDIVKYDGRFSPPANPLDPASWPPTVDANTAATAANYQVNSSGSTGPQPVKFLITNNGATALGNVTVSDQTQTGPGLTNISCDFSPLGGPSSGTTWVGPFLVGTSFTCTGDLTMQAGDVHADTASVIGTSVDSTGAPILGPNGQPTTVTDSDQYNAVTTYQPATSIVKKDQATGSLAATPSTAIVFQPGETRTITIPVTNTGNAALLQVQVSDSTGSGPAMTNFSCVFPDGTTAAADANNVVKWAATFASPATAEWQPGVTFTCTGTLTMTPGSAVHVDTATVSGVPGDSGGNPVPGPNGPPVPVVTPSNPFHAVLPAVDIVKYDGRFPAPADPVNGPWVPTVDANTPATAATYQVNGSGSTGPQPVNFIVTNTGDTALGNVQVTDSTQTGPSLTNISCNFSALGGPATGTTWAGPLQVGASFPCTGTLTMGAGDLHADTAAVIGTSVDSTGAPILGPNGQPVTVGDQDQYHAQTTSQPAVTILKNDQATGAAADTADTAVVFTPGVPRTITMPSTNTGNAPLAAVQVSDLTATGPAMTNFSCVFPDGTTVAAVNGVAKWAATFTTPATAKWLPGVTFTCTGTLTFNAGDQAHANTATVSGTPVDSSGNLVPGPNNGPPVPVVDNNPFHAVSPAIDIVKYDGRYAPPADPVNGPWPPAVDANTPGTAANYPLNAAGSTGPQAVHFIVTNTGNVALGNVQVTDQTQVGPSTTGLTCDFSALGGPATGTTWVGPLQPGASFPCTATLTMAAGDTHADTGTVIGTPVDSTGKPLPGPNGQPVTVTDQDQYNANTSGAVILKNDLATGAPADTLDTAVVFTPGVPRTIVMPATNTGSTALTMVQVSDATASGPKMTNFSCVFPDGSTATAVNGVVKWAATFTVPASVEWMPGVTFSCTGTLTLNAGDPVHTDLVSVTGQPSEYGIPIPGPTGPVPPVTPPPNPFNAVLPAVDIVKYDGRYAPAADPVNGPWVPTVDANTPDTAVIYPVNASGSTGPQPVHFIVTNTGNVALGNVHVSDLTQSGPAVTGLTCDFSALGGPATGTTWVGPLKVGASFPCTGMLTMTAGQTHADTGVVVGTPVDSTGKPMPGPNGAPVTVTDSDKYNAKTIATSITKVDQANGSTSEVFTPGVAHTIAIPVKNTGSVPLLQVQVADVTNSGPKMTNFSCVFPDGTTANADANDVVKWAATFTKPATAVWQPGVAFTCTGSVTLNAGDPAHDDIATVSGVPADSHGNPVPPPNGPVPPGAPVPPGWPVTPSNHFHAVVPPGPLAYTGADARLMLIAGLSLLSLGGLLLIVGKRRRRSDPAG